MSTAHNLVKEMFENGNSLPEITGTLEAILTMAEIELSVYHPSAYQKIQTLLNNKRYELREDKYVTIAADR